ncbi:cobalamin biosynthesis protein [Arsukibacterium sp.]|uniref:cobalamin biosynthesis protein n=1 Tax=Arsukibacterium sp. TaxID=1977258 RepID=UPI002FD8E236
MTPDWLAIISSPAAVWLLAALASHYLSSRLQLQPRTAFMWLAKRLAAKVHPDYSRPAAQQRLAGGLALLLMLLWPLGIAYGLLMISAWPVMIDILLLFICLSWQPYEVQIARIARLLQQPQLRLARQLASPLLLRDTDKLSELGLSKALIESASLRFASQYLAIFFWYLLGGALLALTYALVQAMAQQWSVKLKHNRHFGLCSAVLYAIGQLPGLWLATFLLLLQSALRNSINALRQSSGGYFRLSQAALLRLTSAKLNVRLGGPLFYAQHKLTRERLQAANEPTPADIQRLLRLLRQQQWLVLCGCLVVILLQFVWRALS